MVALSHRTRRRSTPVFEFILILRHQLTERIKVGRIAHGLVQVSQDAVQRLKIPHERPDGDGLPQHLRHGGLTVTGRAVGDERTEETVLECADPAPLHATHRLSREALQCCQIAVSEQPWCDRDGGSPPQMAEVGGEWLSPRVRPRQGIGKGLELRTRPGNLDAPPSKGCPRIIPVCRPFGGTDGHHLFWRTHDFLPFFGTYSSSSPGPTSNVAQSASSVLPSSRLARSAVTPPNTTICATKHHTHQRASVRR